MTTILCTKRLSKKQEKQFHAANLGVIHKNFIQTKAKPFEIKNKTDLILFTSKNAVKSVLQSNHVAQIKHAKCCCVGSKTKQLLEKNNFQVVAYADYAQDLSHIIKAQFQNKSFTFFSGNLRKDTLPKFFITNNILYTEIEVYTTNLKPSQVKQAYNSVLFFSPSGIASFLKQNHLDNQTCICIGTTTAKALQYKTKKIIIAPKQTVKSVIQTAILHANKT